MYGSGYTLGDTFEITDVIVLNEKYLRVMLSAAVVVDTTFLSTASYVLTTNAGDSVATYVSKVVSQSDGSKLVTEILLEITLLPPGDLFKLTISGLKTSSGIAVTASSVFYGRATKTDAIMHSLPDHFASDMNSSVGILSAAISTEDDYIGGQRSFAAPFNSIDYLITDLGARIADDTGEYTT